jgi:hypothetical protein
VKAPTAATLRKYGLTGDDWRTLAWTCPSCAICVRLFASGVRAVVDHEHVRGFKKMTPADKRRHVRGLLCGYCNRWLVSKNTVVTAAAVLAYMNRPRPFAGDDK